MILMVGMPCEALHLVIPGLLKLEGISETSTANPRCYILFYRPTLQTAVTEDKRVVR